MAQEKVTKATLDRYLETSSLSEEQKEALKKEFAVSNGDRSVFQKAVSLNHRKVQGKVPGAIHTK